MKKEKGFSIQAIEKKAIRNIVHPDLARDAMGKDWLQLSDEAIDRFLKTKESGKWRDLLCEECKHLIQLADFHNADGTAKTVKLSIPETQEQKDQMTNIVANAIVELKLQDELGISSSLNLTYQPRPVPRPLTGKLSRWKKLAAILFYNKSNHNTARQVEKLVKRFNAYTPDEIKSMASKV